MTSGKLSLMTAAAGVVLVGAAAQYALAATAPPRSSATVNTGTLTSTAPMSHPVNGGILRPKSGLTVATALSEAECTGIGGKVINNQSCSSGRQCVTANQDNTTHYKCISKKQ